jgi:trimeric autotransporter adhesin
MSGFALRPVLVGLSLLVVGVPVAVAGSGVGGVFNLGQVNTVDATSELSGSSAGGAQLRVVNNAASSNGVEGVTGDGWGVVGRATSSGGGVFGSASSGVGVRGDTTSGWGLFGNATGGGGGVYGSAPAGTAVRGDTGGGWGVFGKATDPGGGGVYAAHTNTSGLTPAIRGDTDSTTGGAIGVLGQVTSTAGFGIAVRALNAGTGGGYGLYASQNGSGIGVVGTTAANGFGVYGLSGSAGIGTEGQAGLAGVVGQATSTSGTVYGVFGGAPANGWAGYFAGHAHVTGDLSVEGNLSVTGAKMFRIDDPLDPAGKFLVHAAVESNEVLNVYSGNVTTNGAGLATVQLPAYFDQINSDFRYQLTVIGQFAQAIVGKEIANNRFTIRTSKPNVKVSWQVTAKRDDAYMRGHPFQAEQAKTDDQRGRYVTPEAYGKPASEAIDAAPQLPQPQLPPASASQPLPPPKVTPAPTP